MQKKLATLFFLLFIFVFAFAIYSPGLNGDFEFDDQANLLSNTHLQIDHLSYHSLKIAALSGDAGPLGRPISLVTFAINYYLAGFNPYYLKLTNIGIHIASGLTLILLFQQLLIAYRTTYAIALTDPSIRFIAYIAGTAWMLHPLDITSVLYIVQRMTSLSGLFTLLALLLYALGRNRICEGKRGWALVVLASPFFGLLAVFSKENAAVLPLYAFLIELFFFRFRAPSLREHRLLHALYALVLWIPLVIGVAFVIAIWDWFVTGYTNRGFTMGERLLTEGRILWFYLRLIFLPNVSLMGIYHDDIALSTGIVSPTTTALSIVGLGGMLICGVLIQRRIPILAFAIFWFLAGHIIESSLIPLELAHEHRNYLPMAGFIFAAFYYLTSPNTPHLSLRLRFGLAALLVTLLAFSTHVRAKQWGNLLEHAILEVENHPASPRAQQQLGRMYFKLYQAERREDFYFKAKQHFETASKLDSHFKSGLYAMIILEFTAGKNPSDQTLEEFQYRIKNKRREPGDIAMFESLVRCQINGGCKLADSVMLELMEAEVNRYRDDPTREASFLSLLGSYASQKMDNPTKAGEYLKQATIAFPSDVQSHLNYAWYLANMNDFEQADQHMRIAKKLDQPHEKFRSRIAMLKRYIEELRLNDR